MGLMKICDHGLPERTDGRRHLTKDERRRRDRAIERCDCPWWGTFRGTKVSLPKWTDRAIATKDDAAAALLDLEQVVRAGTFDPRGLVVKPSVVTFRDFADDYWKRHAIRLRGAATVKSRLEIVAGFFDRRPMRDLRPADLDDLFNWLAQPTKLSPGQKKDRTRSRMTINRFRSLMRHMFRWAIEEDLIEKTPFKSKRHGPTGKGDNRTRRLASDEELRLLQASAPWLRNMIIAALDTGMRRGEMLALTVADLDAKSGHIRLRWQTTKSAKTRHVPVSTERLRQVLDWQRLDTAGREKADTEFVFCTGIGERRKPDSYRKPFHTAMTTAGIEGYRWHDLRHEFGSRLTERNVPLSQVRDLMGHSSVTTTERYDNQREAALVTATKHLEAAGVPLVQILSSQPATTPAAKDLNVN
jgi:integrase